jgi:hypothetical protein
LSTVAAASGNRRGRPLRSNVCSRLAGCALRGSADLGRLVELVSAIRPADAADEALARIRRLEELKAAAAAAQAREMVALDEIRRDEQQAAGVPKARLGQGVAHEVALARRCSPFHGARQLGWAKILVRELPATFRALQSGVTTEWRTMLVARETGGLSLEARAEVDARLGPLLGDLGDRAVRSETRRLAYRLDPQGYVRRLSNAEADRRVTLRPAPDAMVRLSALMPVKQGVATLAALSRAADSDKASGDARSRGQVMADTLVERVTGQSVADHVPVLVNVILTDQALVRRGELADEPGELDGYGPIPAALARRLGTPDDEVPVWLRRLYSDPAGRLVSMESSRRCFTPAQREFVRLRDQHCRTPYCDAPIRHVDHILPARRNGPTSLQNAAGLCEACNYAKEVTPRRSRAPAA